MMNRSLALIVSFSSAMLVSPVLVKADAHPPEQFPGIGRILEVHLENRSYELRFEKDGRTLHFRGTRGDSRGNNATVLYESLQLAPGVWRLTWQRPSIPINVVHIENWNDNTVYVTSNYIDDNTLKINNSQGVFWNSD